MLATLLLLGAASACPVDAGPVGVGQDSLEALYHRGRSFPEFLASVRSRRQVWTDSYKDGWLTPEEAARVRQLPAGYRFLVIAVDRCSDSANTIPYLARLVEASNGALDLRIVLPEEGKWVQEAHRTADGRAATPTVVLLDAAGVQVGCWVERPAALARWVNAQRDTVRESELTDRKMRWYREDRGRSTIREMLDLLEQAGPARRCTGNT